MSIEEKYIKLNREYKKLNEKNKKLEEKIKQLEKEKQKERHKLYDCLYEFKKLKEGDKKPKKTTNLSSEDLKEINKLINKINKTKK